jgi:hypothetical protein
LVGIGAAPGDDRWKTEAAAHQLRVLLIHGRARLSPGLAKKDTPLGRLVKALLARAHRNVVPLANKLARIAWTVLARDRRYVAVQTAAS